MGTALRDEYPVDPETVWSPVKLLISAYDRITLHPSNPRYELTGPARVNADQLFGIIYSEIIEELRHNLSPQSNQPVPVYPFAYDWRQPLENVQNALADFIDEVLERTRLLQHYYDAGFGDEARFPARVNLVAHSMGGLVVAGYLQARGMDKIYKVATIAAPLRGSLESITKTAIGVGALGNSPGSSREREAARLTPSLYYLLPSFAGAVTLEGQPAPDAWALFQVGQWQPGILQTLASFIGQHALDKSNPNQQARQLLQAMLDKALAYRNGIEALRLADSKKWLSIVGVGASTRVTMDIVKDDDGNPRFVLDDSGVQEHYSDGNPVETGDNTVPYFGARTSCIPTEQVVCVSPKDFSFWEFKDRLLESQGLHITLPNMNLVQRLVTSHLKDQIYGDVWGRPAPDLPAGVAWDPPIAGLKMAN